MHIPGTVMIKIQTPLSDLDEVLAKEIKKNRWYKIVKKFENEEIHNDKKLMTYFSINKSSSEAVKTLVKELKISCDKAILFMTNCIWIRLLKQFNDSFRRQRELHRC